ncbi:hypothetical protein WBP06_22100 [Novosphingobium sp. BL-8H]|uniref:hypothetical protein n=1 Tax=Novosphingobium sp. BL-8H TaxID=3127640 RepID=UPI003756C976
MIRTMFAIAAAAGMLAATPSMAASQCKDASGKFVKCPTTAKTTAKAAPSGAIAKGKDGKCRYTSGPKKGQFAKCP